MITPGIAEGAAISIVALQEAAMGLQPAARARLTRALVQSFADLPEAEIAALWLDEAEARDAELESGAVTGIAADDFFAQLRSRHAR